MPHLFDNAQKLFTLLVRTANRQIICVMW